MVFVHQFELLLIDGGLEFGSGGIIAHVISLLDLAVFGRSCFASTLLITDRSGREKMAKAFGLSLMRNSRTPGKDLRYGMKETEQLTAPMKQI